MGKRRSAFTWLIFLGAGVLGGCSRQDTECLSGIGRKIADRASAATAHYRQHLDALNFSRGDNLVERVRLRLRWEKVLAGVQFEVLANGTEIELKGNFKNAEQRARAVELAESTAGVERVLVSLTVGDEKRDD
jgi:osmotically-inducible protein OsmY